MWGIVWMVFPTPDEFWHRMVGNSDEWTVVIVFEFAVVSGAAVVVFAGLAVLGSTFHTLFARRAETLGDRLVAELPDRERRRDPAGDDPSR
jgi:hypothetical protein